MFQSPQKLLAILIKTTIIYYLTFEGLMEYLSEKQGRKCLASGPTIKIVFFSLVNGSAL